MFLYCCMQGVFFVNWSSIERCKVVMRVRWVKMLLVLLVVMVAGGSLFLYSYGKKYERYLMFFRNKITGEVQLENRYIAQPTEKNNIDVFVEEFLLGPANHELSSFFPHGTTYRSLFLRDDVLYLDLPSEAVQNMTGGATFEDFYTLFTKSLKINFPNIKTTNIFVAGVKVYEKTAMSN